MANHALHIGELTSRNQSKMQAKMSNTQPLTLEELVAYGEVQNRLLQVQHAEDLNNKKKLAVTEVLKSPLPKRYQNASLNLNPFQSKTQIEVAKNYVKQFRQILETTGHGLILHGEVGSGKTYFACAIANGLIEKKFTVAYSTVTEICTLMTAAKNFANKVDESQILANYESPDLLIIDEVGLKTPTSFEQNLIATIIDLRYRNMRPVIIVSNQTPRQLPLILSEMAWSRLSGHGAIQLAFDGEDLRQKMLHVTTYDQNLPATTFNANNVIDINPINRNTINQELGREVAGLL